MHFLVALSPGHHAYYSICLYHAVFTPVFVVLIVKLVLELTAVQRTPTHPFSRAGDTLPIATDPADLAELAQLVPRARAEPVRTPSPELQYLDGSTAALPPPPFSLTHPALQDLPVPPPPCPDPENLDQNWESEEPPDHDDHFFRPHPYIHNGIRAHKHPHQFSVITSHDGHHTWRSIELTASINLIEHIPSTNYLHLHPPAAFITPFWSHIHHIAKVGVTDHNLTRQWSLKPLIICSNLGIYPLDHVFPFGHLVYSFAESLTKKFKDLPPPFLATYHDTLTLITVQDFLDGRLRYTYGRIHFDEDRNIKIEQITNHIIDLFHLFPTLTRYTFSPRLPVDPPALLNCVYPNREHIYIEPRS
ncbi:hypothetical protein BC827DRAFT_1267089 [Russula dissimulans]|nr:hypothetical protein BC827DRAFT_1267089 [Russula dissimulans]